MRLCHIVQQLLAASLVATSVNAATTGRLAGRIIDGVSTMALPGVTVEVSSPSLLAGTQRTASGPDGTFLFPALAAGVYSISFSLPGYASLEQPNIVVRLDRTTSVNASMSVAVTAEQITVRGDAPLADPERVTEGQVFSREYLSKAALGSAGRSYQAILGQTAGVVGESVLGSTIAENVYLIDGTDSTDPVTATFGVNFNFDAIEQIAFQTAAFEAEYGRATGGVVNLITKSGGDRYSGTLDVRYRTEDFAERGEHFDPDTSRTRFARPAATLGGPIRRQRAWFFASAENIDSERTPNESPTTRDFEGQNLLAKASWQVSPSWRAVVKGSGDPATITNANAGRNTLPEASATQEQGGTNLQLEIAGQLGSDLLWDLLLGRNRQELDTFPTSGDLETPGITDDGTGIASSNYTNAQFSDRDRDEASSSLTWSLDGPLGRHDLKGGLSYDDLFFRTTNFTTGDASYQHRGGRPRLLFVSPRQAPFEFNGAIASAYLQDGWHPLPTLTAKVGLRYDRATFDNDRGRRVATLEEVQPRLGFAWDPRGDARTVVRASWGKFMHPNALTLPSFARSEQSRTDLYFACARAFPSRQACSEFFGSDVIIADPLGLDPLGFILLDSFSALPNQVAPGLDPTVAETVTLGVEQQIGARTSVELSYVDKETTDIFEDTCDGNLPIAGASGNCDLYVIANLAGLRRDYQGFLLRVDSRAAEWFHLIGSYTYSKSRGNIEYTQNAGIDFDVFPVHFDNRFGYLGDDRRHRVKVNGYINLPFDISVGLDAFWSSAFAYSVTENADPYGNTFLEPRGSRRGNSNHQVDIEIHKGLRIGPANLELIGTVFNLLDDEQTTGVCGDAHGCGEDSRGPLLLGAATDFQLPRRYEVGLRIEF